jgi:hydrogenase/urease accessory protein HupE
MQHYLIIAASFALLAFVTQIYPSTRRILSPLDLPRIEYSIAATLFCFGWLATLVVAMPLFIEPILKDKNYIYKETISALN